MLILVRAYVLYRRTVRRYPSVAALLWAYIDRKWRYWARLGLADRVPLLHVITALVQSELKVEGSTGKEKIIVVTYIFFSLLFWLAVHGKPVLFWKCISGLKFHCFYFMHANCPNGDRNQSSFGRFRYYNVNYRTFVRR